MTLSLTRSLTVLLAAAGLACGGSTASGSNGTTDHPSDSGTGGASGGSGTGGATEAGVAPDSDTPISPAPKTSKLDLLFMIDSSSSMADKQEVLAQAVPDLVYRLVNPPCVNDDGTLNGPADATGGCVAPAHRAFHPVKDLHIGIITSSLGGHGAQVCTESDVRTDP